MAFHIYEMSAIDVMRWVPQAAVATGGKLTICTAGTTRKATLYNPDDFTALTNPISFSRGRVRFATLDTVLLVDVYGFAPTGHFVNLRGVKPGHETEIHIETVRRNQMAYIPFYAGDYTANSENDTGLDLPTGAALLPGAHLRVTAIDATETLDVGILSSESGGDADGILDGISVATAGTIPATVTGTPTLGLLLTDAGGTTPEVYMPVVYGVGSVAVSISVTPSSGSDTGEGFICLPYALPPL